MYWVVIIGIDTMWKNVALFLVVLTQSSVNVLLFKQVESVNKLYNILKSETVDLVLRRSAADQLTIVLQGKETNLCIPVLLSLLNLKLKFKPWKKCITLK